MVGELRVRALGACGRQGRVELEGVRHSTVQANPLPRQQLAVDRLLEQRVPEPVSEVVHHQSLVLDGRPQPSGQFVRRCRRHLLQQPHVDASADQCREAENLPGFFGQSVHPHREDIAKGGRDRPGPTDRHQLLHEEGIALGAHHQLLQEIP